MRSTNVSLLGRLRDLHDAKSWEDFHRRYAPRLQAWCRAQHFQPADADDITQEVLRRVANAISRETFVYDPTQSFSGWLRTIWSRVVADYLRERSIGARGTGDSAVAQLLANQEGQDWQSQLLERLEHEFERELLEEAFARVQPQVAPEHWTVFLAVCVDGRRASEVAKEQGMSQAGVAMIKRRVQERIRKQIEQLRGS